MQWVEKYRPISLVEITSQNNIIDSLKKAITTKNIPHLIFHGPSGCGKTSTILALAKELFKKYYKDRIIELNASDERGINIVRDKIKMYAKQSVSLNDDIPPWKIIILDEADTMTSDSQFALRRIMEEYSKVTRFCIICNYHNKIIEPIISRCSLFCFKPIEDIEIYNKLKLISEKENCKYSEKILQKIIFISRGDLRKAINLLQKCCNNDNHPLRIGVSTKDSSDLLEAEAEENTDEILNQLSGYLPDNLFNKIIENIYEKNSNKINHLINSIYNEGYSLVNQILLFHNYFINSELNDYQKSLICLKISDIDQNLLKGCDEFIQFMRLIYYIISVL
jgi:replication factor C subunit 2/4